MIIFGHAARKLHQGPYGRVQLPQGSSLWGLGWACPRTTTWTSQYTQARIQGVSGHDQFHQSTPGTPTRPPPSTNEYPHQRRKKAGHVGRSLFAKQAVGTIRAEFPQSIQTMLPPQYQLALIPVLYRHSDLEHLGRLAIQLCRRAGSVGLGACTISGEEW